MPRPRKLCEIKQRDLCALISAGCPLAAAARHVGCSIFTIRREARRNPHFQQQLRCSQLNTELSPIVKLRDAAQVDWRAAAWLLERTQPQEYGRRTSAALGRHELAELVDRIGEVIRDEIRDRRLASRLRRRVGIEVQGVLRKSQSFSAAEKSEPLALVESDDDLPTPESDSDAVTNNMEAKLEQNEAKLEPYLIRACDVPFDESRGIPLATAQ
jgi:hypothetical protein